MDVTILKFQLPNLQLRGPQCPKLSPHQAAASPVNPKPELYTSHTNPYTLVDVAHWPYLHVGHVHDAPAHLGTRARVAAEHIADDDAGEVDVGDAAEPRVVEPLRERRAPARGHQDLRGRRRRPHIRLPRGAAVPEEGEERGPEVRPLRVPLEAVARAAEREELVPVLP